MLWPSSIWLGAAEETPSARNRSHVAVKSHEVSLKPGEVEGGTGQHPKLTGVSMNKAWVVEVFSTAYKAWAPVGIDFDEEAAKQIMDEKQIDKPFKQFRIRLWVREESK